MEQLAELLHSEDEDRRYVAARALADRHPQSLDLLYRLTDDPRPRVRAVACFALGQTWFVDEQRRWEPVVYPESIRIALHRMENDEDADVRGAAASVFGQLKPPEALPQLCTAALDPSGEVRFHVAAALGSYYFDTGPPEWESYKAQVTQTLLRLMDDPDDDVRDWATFAMNTGGHDTPEVRERLWKALDDPNPDVRGEAAAALAEFGDTTLIPRLEQLLWEDEKLSPCYFAAAARLGDPALLPAVQACAERWRLTMEPGEELHSDITWALETLTKAAEAPHGA
jgi:HEAT repeat protein